MMSVPLLRSYNCFVFFRFSLFIRNFINSIYFLLMLISSDIEDLFKGLFIILSFSPIVTCHVLTV